VRREYAPLKRPARAAEPQPAVQAPEPDRAAAPAAEPTPAPGAEGLGHDFGTFGLEGATEAVQTLGHERGGAPLPPSFRHRLERAIGTDFSGVRVHRGPLAERATDLVNSPAVTVGHNIFLAGHQAGQLPAGESAMLAHEAVHVAQQAGGPGLAGEARVGARSDPAEGEADAAASALLRGDPVAPPLSRGLSGAVARRFGAGKYGHGGIESEAAAGTPELAPGDPRKKGVNEMYSGNFMRDMNQLNVPLVVGKLSGLPKDVTSPKGAKIGAKGAHDITTAVIQALAILELGPEVAQSLVTGGEINPAGQQTADRIGVYRPEEHIDNPMGMGAKTDTLVSNTDPAKKDDHGTKVAIGAPRPAEPVVGPTNCPVDKDRDAQLQGSAVKGPQVENAALYKVSGAGLQNHIYNSVEATKKRWVTAARLGPTPEGRSEFGAGLHAVEDYFSHSNFIEVSLNSYIAEALANKGTRRDNPAARKFAETVVDRNKSGPGGTGLTAQGYYVDTMFDAKVGDAKDKRKKRQAITTGSFGGTDTKVSIAHILLPQMPKLQKAMLRSVDMLFGIAAADGGDGGWAHLKEQLSSEPAGAAGARLLEGFSAAGMVAPVPDIELDWNEYEIDPVGAAAGLLGGDSHSAAAVSVRVPVGIKHLSKTLPLTDAVATYGGIYKRGKEMVDLVQQYADYAKQLVPAPIAKLIEDIKAELTKIDQKIRREIKSQVVGGLVALVDSISGRSEAAKAKAKAEGKKPDPTNPDAEFEKDMGDALEYLHEGVEAEEQTTSLESRLKNGDLSKLPKLEVESRVGPVEEVEDQSTVIGKDPATGQKIYRKYYRSKLPLPPSHSEISKDHEPHEEHGETLDRHHDPGDKEGLEKGSAFFGLARSLAVEAVKHCNAQLQSVWSRRPNSGDASLYGDGSIYQYKSGSDPAGSAKIHDDVMAEAAQRAAAEKKRAAREGTSFLGADPANPDAVMLKDPEVAKLVSLVDTFVAHPDDTAWWKPVTTAYIASDPESVYDSILRRNKMRGARDLK
jgi:hypothetical protein